MAAAFLEDNARKPGVVVLPSGLQYRVERASPVDAKSPLPITPVECHYRGTLVDGTEFDSSHSRGKPAILAPCAVIKGWSEALQLMGEGDKWTVYVPPALGYGGRSKGDHIKPHSVLIFELELLAVLSPNGEACKTKPDTRLCPTILRTLKRCYQLT